MGNKQHSFKEQSGYRILSVKEGSPLQGQLDPYFDYIVDLVCQPSPKEILQKLTDQPPKHQLDRPFLARLKEQEGKKVVLKVFSGKDCSISEVDFIPQSNWSSDKNDFIGVTFRLERYADVQDNYCRVTHVKPNSPIALAAVKEGEYLIGVEQFKYETISELTDRLYERLYDPEVQDKHVNFAIYNVITDQIRTVSIELKRKWGGEGLLGCELSQGHLYRFPQNLEKFREGLKLEEKKKQEILASRKELCNSDGAGKLLAESLKRRINNQPKRRLVIRNPERLAELKEHLEGTADKVNERSPNGCGSLEERVQRLQRTVQVLQRALLEHAEPE